MPINNLSTVTTSEYQVYIISIYLMSLRLYMLWLCVPTINITAMLHVYWHSQQPYWAHTRPMLGQWILSLHFADHTYLWSTQWSYHKMNTQIIWCLLPRSTPRLVFEMLNYLTKVQIRTINWPSIWDWVYNLLLTLQRSYTLTTNTMLQPCTIHCPDKPQDHFLRHSAA